MTIAEGTRRHAAERRRFVFTGRMALASLLAFFAVVMAVNAIMMTLALKTLPGTVADSAYAASQRYNADVAGARERDATGVTVEAALTRVGERDARVALTLAGPDGRTLFDADVVATLLRPLDRRQDRTVALARGASGAWLGAASDVAPGAYDLVIEARRGDALIYRSRNRVALP